jgi:hypothetical protein
MVEIHRAFGAKPFVAGLTDADGITIRMVKAAHDTSDAWYCHSRAETGA